MSYFPEADPKDQLAMSRSLESGRTDLSVVKEGVKLAIREMPPQEEAVEEEFGRGLAWSQIRRNLQMAFSEFFGTFILLLFGLGSIAQVTLSNDQKGTFISTNWGMGIGLMMGAYAAGKSGGHLNPAVTLAMCVYRKHPWRMLPVYVGAQLLGGFCAAAVVYGDYKSAINAFEGGSHIRTVPSFSPTATAGIFATYPATFMTRTGEFFNEFIATAVLFIGIISLADKTHGAGKLMPIGLLILVFGIGLTFGSETGYAMNPARDLPPRLLTYAVGYGQNVWKAGGFYFWIPVVAPCLGALFGGFLYDTLIFTGESPINTPWMGMKRPFRPTSANEAWNYV